MAIAGSINVVEHVENLSIERFVCALPEYITYYIGWQRVETKQTHRN